MSKLPIDVLVLPFRESRVREQDTQARWKRTTIWENLRRNQFVAEIAQSLTRSAFRALRKQGVAKSAIALLARSEAHRVVVLTETAEQGWALHELLPNWDVCDALHTNSEDTAWVRPKKNVPETVGRIVTLMYAYRYRVSCDILVRATAGTGRLNWYPSPRGQLLDRKPALIVDVADESQPNHAGEAKTRMREYVEQGLKVQCCETFNRTQ